MNIISNFNKKTKDIQYILEIENIQYDLSKMIDIEIPFNNSFIKDIPEEDIIEDFDTIIEVIPSKIIEKIFPDNNILITHNEQYGWYYIDSLSQERIRSLIFVYINSRGGGYTIVKLTSLSDYFIIVKQYYGIKDQDHPKNNKVYKEYYIYLKPGTKLFSNLLSYSYDYNFDNSIDIGILDGNNVVYHHRMLIEKYNTEVNVIQNINFIFGIDIYSLSISNMYSSISKRMYYIGDEEENCLQVDPEIILKTKVYDIFGNSIEFENFKDYLSTIRK